MLTTKKCDYCEHEILESEVCSICGYPSSKIQVPPAKRSWKGLLTDELLEFLTRKKVLSKVEKYFKKTHDHVKLYEKGKVWANVEPSQWHTLWTMFLWSDTEEGVQFWDELNNEFLEERFNELKNYGK